MGRGKWDFRVDAKMVWLPFCCYVLFLVWVVATKKTFYIGSLREIEGVIFVSSDILYYFQFIPSFFVIFLTTSVFAETYRPISSSLIRTFPLSVYQIWGGRTLNLCAALYAVLVPAILVGTMQANDGIQDFIQGFDLPLDPGMFSPYPILLNCLGSIVFLVFATQALFALTRHRALTTMLLFVFCVLVAGPLWKVLGQYNPFYGCFSPFPMEPVILPNVWSLLSLALILGSALFFYFKSLIKGSVA